MRALDSESLYKINEALTELAQELGIREQFAAGADAEYDEIIDDATHAVARIFFPDGA